MALYVAWFMLCLTALSNAEIIILSNDTVISEKYTGKTRREVVVAWCRHLPGRAEGSPGKNSDPQAKREDTGPTEIGV